MATTNGRRIALLVAALAVAVLGVAAWIGWPHLQFWWLFEPLGRNAQGYPEYRHDKTGIVFVRLPGGTFLMGARAREGEPAEVYERRAEFAPVHSVSLSVFLIGKYEVTQAEWRRGGMFAGTSQARPEEELWPIGDITWSRAREFCDGNGLRLPSEAQWEYACTGGRAEWTPDASESAAWVLENSGRAPHPVGRRAANVWGVHDMIGNLWEWCEDFYDPKFYLQPEAASRDPECLAGERHVLRGGAYGTSATSSDPTGRGPGPWENKPDVGFRAAFWPLP